MKRLSRGGFSYSMKRDLRLLGVCCWLVLLILAAGSIPGHRRLRTDHSHRRDRAFYGVPGGSTMLETIIFVLGIGLDRLAKWLIVSFVQPLPGGDLPLWPGVFHFTYVENTGAAFGILGSSRFVFIGIGIAVSVAIVYLLLRKRTKYPLWMRCAMAAVLAGTVGNMIDRIAYGYVVDFAYFKLIDFAVFNVADALMVVGVICIAVYLIFFYKEPARTGEKA